MRATTTTKTVLWAAALAGCLAPPNECRRPDDPGGAPPTADEVCDHLAAIGCFTGAVPTYLDAGPDGGIVEVRTDAAGRSIREVHGQECRAGHAEWQAYLPRERFHALLRCYMAATDCALVEACNRGCELAAHDAGSEQPEAGEPIDAHIERDAGLDLDGGPGMDAAPDGGLDAGRVDAGADGGAGADFDASADGGAAADGADLLDAEPPASGDV